MKQIINWTIGSFFRSIGRIIAYLVIGGIIAYLVSGGDFRRFKITDLFFEKVGASGIAGYGYFANAYKSDGTQLANGSYFVDGIRVNITDKDKHILFNNQGNLNGSGISLSYQNQYKQIVFQVGFFSNSAIAQVITSGAAYARFARNGSFYASTICYFTGELDADFDTTDTTSGVNAEYYNLVCPLPVYSGSNITLTRLTISIAQTSANEFFEINRNVTYLLNENYILEEGQQATTNAINNQTNTITNTNSTQEVSEATDYFESVNDTSQDGIKAIVSMPLNIFNALTLGSTQDLCFTLKSKQTCLPSGNIIWGKTNRTQIRVGNATVTQHAFSNQDIPTGINNFKIIFNLVVGGYLAYKMLKSLMRITTDMLLPTKDKVEVLEL